MIRAVWVALSLVVLGAAGCAGTAPEVSNGDPVLEQGRDVYVGKCASCHGMTGGGGRGPAFNEGRLLASVPDEADQIQIVTEGRNDMPPFAGQLTSSDISAVVRYTREVVSSEG